MVPDGASSFKPSEWILTRVSQCSEAFAPGYHVLPSALFGAQPSTHRHQLAPEVPTPVWRLVFTVRLDWFFFFSPPAAPCHARIWSGAPPAGQTGGFVSSRQNDFFKGTFSRKELFPPSSDSAGKQVFPSFSISRFPPDAITTNSRFASMRCHGFV